MAKAKLHIICGNCGCNDEFRFVIDPQGHDISDTETKFKPAVYITCNNCSTLHDLSETVPEVLNESNDKTKSPGIGIVP